MTDYQEMPEQQPGEDKHDPFSEFLRHEQSAFAETSKALDALLPPGFKEHSREAGREFVKGIKVLFDAAIEEVEKASREFDKNFNRQPPTEESGGDRPSTTGTTKVKVQVD